MASRSNGNGRGKREGAKLAARRAEVFRRWRAGETMRQIASSMVPKMSAQLVAIDCQIALREWREEHRGSIKETAELEWQLLNWAQLELQQGWEDSKDPKKRQKIGDPRFIEGILKTGEHRRKLLGIDKPTKVEAQTTAEVNVSTTFRTLDEMRDDVRKRQAEMAARLAEMEESD